MTDKNAAEDSARVGFVPLKFKLLGIGLLGIVITATLIGGFNVWKARERARLEIEGFEKSILQNRKQELANITDTAYSALVSAYRDANSEERIRAIVEERLKASLDVLYANIQNEYRVARASGS